MNTKKKKLTAIIIAAVAVVLAAVIVVTCVVLRRSDSGNSDTLGGSSKNPPSVTYNPEEGKTVTYEKATFNGYTMPAGFVEVMEAANEISEKECNEKGIALTVGEHEISVSEFAMSYYDTYTNAVYEYSSDTQTTKGLKPTSRPSQLEYAGDVTWKERLEELAIEDVRKKYVLAFDALSQGFEISDEGYEAVAEEFNANYEYVTSEGITENEFMETAYLAPIPYELYQRSYILMKYAEEYEEALKKQFSSSYSQEDVEAFYAEASFLYDYVDVYIMFFNLGAELDPSSYSHIRTKDEFIDFHRQYYKDNNYGADNIEESATWTKSSYKDLGAAIGKDVADWCFDASRKEGDLEVVRGVLYDCLIFVEKTAYKEESVDFLDCYLYYLYAGGSTEEACIKLTDEKMAEIQKKFEKTDKTPADFKEIAMLYSHSPSVDNEGLNSAVRLSNDDELYEKEALRWCFDEGRKAGDYACIKTDYGYQLIYFLSKNEGDYDYVYGILKHFSETDFDEYVNGLLDYENNVTTLNKANCAAGSDIGEEAAARYVELALSSGYSGY